MKALIKEIRDEAYRNNGVLLVGMIPSPFQVYPDVYDHMLRGTYAGNKAVASYLKDPAKPQRIMCEICEELNIPCLDLLPILIQNNAKELYIPADGHLSKEGHAVVAQQLATFVIKHSGVTRTQTSLENPSKAMSQDAAILLPKYISTCAGTHPAGTDRDELKGLKERHRSIWNLH